MKKLMTVVITAVLMAASLGWAKEPPRMKMTTEVPPGIATPNKLETSLGTLTSVDGVPGMAWGQAWGQVSY
ncbi:MAG: hypothetical protein ACNY01_13195 [Desulfobacteria bacterium]